MARIGTRKAGGQNNATKITDCNHGLALTIPDDTSHPISNFMDTYAVNAAHKSMAVLDNLIDIFANHEEVWRNDGYRKMAITILTSTGISFILGLDGAGEDIIDGNHSFESNVGYTAGI